ncbi:MAG: hypothetical protein J7K73_04035 [Nanoarchaeota archaeon]|nr:hypothetical protein [Nanoarchaeota archaeon]
MSEASLEERLDNRSTPVSLLSDVDIYGSKVFLEKLPESVYRPSSVIEIANAYKGVDLNADYAVEYDEKKKIEKERKYQTNSQIIVAFEARISELEKQLKEEKVRSKQRQIRRAKLYMEAFKRKALSLAQNLEEIEVYYEQKKKEEEIRYKRKLAKLEKDKNKQIDKIKKERGFLRKVAIRASESAVPLLTYLTTVEFIPNTTSRILVAIATVLPTVGFGEYFIGRMEDKRIKSIVEDYEPIFEKIDTHHSKVLAELDAERKSVMKRKYERAVAELLEELNRYFPEAVDLKHKSGPAAGGLPIVFPEPSR